MRSRTLLVSLLGILGALLVLAGVTFAYDQSRSDRIADGVRIQGIDVGGLSVADARTKLRRELVEPLDDPITIRLGEKRYRLTARQARLGVSVDTSVREALARSREGWFVTRTVRSLTGGELDERLPVVVTYDRSAVDKLVARIGKAAAKPAVDAKADIGLAGVGVQRSAPGRRLRNPAGLRRSLLRRLRTIRLGGTLHARTVAVAPKVTTDQVAGKYPTVLVVDRRANKLTLYKDLEVEKTYDVSVGKIGYETPTGLYSIQTKQVDPAWHVPNSEWAGKLAGKVIPPNDPRNPLKARWMGIIGGAGIHGTSDEGSLGSAASHGCVRMLPREVIDLYDRVPVGSPVYIG